MTAPGKQIPLWDDCPEENRAALFEHPVMLDSNGRVHLFARDLRLFIDTMETMKESNMAPYIDFSMAPLVDSELGEQAIAMLCIANPVTQQRVFIEIVFSDAGIEVMPDADGSWWIYEHSPYGHPEWNPEAQ